MLKAVPLLQNEVIIPLLAPCPRWKGSGNHNFILCCHWKQEQYLFWRGGTELSASYIVPRRYWPLLMGNLHLSLQNHFCKCNKSWWGFAAQSDCVAGGLQPEADKMKSEIADNRPPKTDFQRLLAKTGCDCATGLIPYLHSTLSQPSLHLFPPGFSTGITMLFIVITLPGLPTPWHLHDTFALLTNIPLCPTATSCLLPKARGADLVSGAIPSITSGDAKQACNLFIVTKLVVACPLQNFAA